MKKKKSIPKFLFKKLKKEYRYSCEHDPEIVVAFSYLIGVFVSFILIMVASVTDMPSIVGVPIAISTLLVLPTLVSWPVFKAYIIGALEEMGYYDE